jgi:NifU-like protein
VADVYPEKVKAHFVCPGHAAGKHQQANAEGNSAGLLCGTYVRVSLCVNGASKFVEQASFRSNGCGYMIAAANVLAHFVEGKLLTDLHGLATSELRSMVEHELGSFDSGRGHCLATAVEAVRSAFKDFRARQIEEFAGEKALICTCFGVTEEKIESMIVNGGAASVEEVGRRCNAGTGCGSCQFMIQEMVDLLAGSGE